MAMAVREEKRDNKCFANAKDSVYTIPTDKYRSRDTCYALNDDASHKMRVMGCCGTKLCPFYKERRMDIRRD